MRKCDELSSCRSIELAASCIIPVCLLSRDVSAELSIVLGCFFKTQALAANDALTSLSLEGNRVRNPEFNCQFVTAVSLLTWVCFEQSQ